MNVSNVITATKSLCGICYAEVPAQVCEEDGRIFIKKQCPVHGESKALVEVNADFYKWYSSLPNKPYSKFDSLYIPITFGCNMNCTYCLSWSLKKQDPAADQILKIAKDFAGQTIYLSGGEPTTRKDLLPLIKGLKQLGKRVWIISNGLNLADLSYVGKLKAAGLNTVFLSLDSLRNDFYNLIKAGASKNIADLKKQALLNLGATGIKTVINTVIYPGLNENELKDIFLLALKNRSFIFQHRLESCMCIGKDRALNQNGYCFSELVKLFSEEFGIDEKRLRTRLLSCRLGKNLIFSIGSNDIGKPTRGFFGQIATKLLRQSGDASDDNKIQVRITGTTTVEDIDLEEIKTPVAYLHNMDTPLTFTHGIVLQDKPGLPAQ